MTRNEAVLLVAVPVPSLTRQRNWSSSMRVAVAIVRAGVAVPP